MGANQFGSQDGDVFYIRSRQCSYDYPTNAALQQRINVAEWNQFNDYVKPYLQKMRYLIFAVVLLLTIGFLLLFISPYFLILVIFLFLLNACIVFYQLRKLRYAIAQYNAALFYPRGIFIQYRSSKESSYLFGRIAYPATEQAALALEDVESNSIFLRSNLVRAAASPELLSKFREANEQFARHQLSMSAASSATLETQQIQSYANNIVIQVAAPPNAYPGLPIQITYNGHLFNVNVPPNVAPGQVFPVSVPAFAVAAPPASNNTTPPSNVPMHIPSMYAPSQPGYQLVQTHAVSQE